MAISKIKMTDGTIEDIAVSFSNVRNAEDLTAIEALTGTGFLCRTGDNTWSISSITASMQFKGTVNSDNDLPASHIAGDVYIVATAGTYVGQVCENGDMIICITTGTVASNNDWAVVQTNIDGAVTGPASSTNNSIAVYDGVTGKVIKDGNIVASSILTDSNTTFTPSLTSGTKIGVLTINGSTYDLYSTVAPYDYVAASDNAEYPVLFKNSTGTTTTAAGDKFDATGIKFNPSTDTLTATNYVGNGAELTNVSHVTVNATQPTGNSNGDLWYEIV